MKLSLRQFTVITTVLGLTLTLLLIYNYLEKRTKSIFIENKIKTAESLSRLLSEEICKKLELPHSREEVREILRSIESSFGDELNLKVHSDKCENSVKVLENRVIYKNPIPFNENCFKCHNRKKDACLSVILNFENEAKKFEISFAQLMVLTVIIPIILSFAYSEVLRRFISTKIKAINLALNRGKSLDETIKFLETELNKSRSFLTEIENLRVSLLKCIKDVSDMAIDKEVLENQLKIMEKLIITSEVLKDWETPVKEIIATISEDIPIVFVFILTFAEGQAWELYVFWSANPDSQLKKKAEEVIKEVLNKKFLEGNLSIIHKVIDKEQSIGLSEVGDLETRIKSILLDKPKIGGVVGIGISTKRTITNSQQVAINGLLTTLLNVVGSIRAISKYTKEIEYYATRDPLTDLYNQRVFWEFLQYETNRARRQKYKFALLVIDLDNFKLINDTYGHAFGDSFLQNFAKILKQVARKSDIVARFGGDEFCIIMPEADEEEAYLLAQKIKHAAEENAITAPDGKPVSATVSIGIAVYPDHATTPKDLFMVADNMMYKAKKEGKDRIAIPDLKDLEKIYEKKEKLNSTIIYALKHDKVIPYFQPILNTKTGKIEAHEILMRIETENGEVLPAYKFIEVAEDMGIIYKLELQMLDKVFEKVQSSGYKGYLFINFSPKSIVVTDYLNTIRNMVKKYNIDPSKIVFEITERETVRNLEILQTFVNSLKKLGFQFAIDDFGSGYSSYLYVKHLPINFVKIEGDFIKEIAESKLDEAIVRSITVLCQYLGIQTVAEFVENKEILNKCKELGVDFAQGYFIGKPSRNLVVES